MSELYVWFCYVQLFLIRAPIIARKEMAMRLLDVCWRDDAGPECAIEGSRIELCAVEGSLVSNMCAGGKDRRLDVRWRETWMVRCVLEGMSGQTAWRNPPAHTKNRKMGRHSRQRTFFKCSCPPAHTYSGSFSFGLREWTITKLSRPFFSIEQSR